MNQTSTKLSSPSMLTEAPTIERPQFNPDTYEANPQGYRASDDSGHESVYGLPFIGNLSRAIDAQTAEYANSEGKTDLLNSRKSQYQQAMDDAAKAGDFGQVIKLHQQMLNDPQFTSNLPSAWDKARGFLGGAVEGVQRIFGDDGEGGEYQVYADKYNRLKQIKKQITGEDDDDDKNKDESDNKEDN